MNIYKTYSFRYITYIKLQLSSWGDAGYCFPVVPWAVEWLKVHKFCQRNTNEQSTAVSGCRYGRFNPIWNCPEIPNGYEQKSCRSTEASSNHVGDYKCEHTRSRHQIAFIIVQHIWNWHWPPVMGPPFPKKLRTVIAPRTVQVHRGLHSLRTEVIQNLLTFNISLYVHHSVFYSAFILLLVISFNNYVHVKSSVCMFACLSIHLSSFLYQFTRLQSQLYIQLNGREWVQPITLWANNKLPWGTTILFDTTATIWYGSVWKFEIDSIGYITFRNIDVDGTYCD